MSSSSEGPGWWQASNGQWYPPQAKPGAFLPIKTKRPVYKRWYFWVLVVIVVIFVITIAAG
jgi:hypothetical protein